MDIGKFLSRLALKNRDAFRDHYHTVINAYERETGISLDREEVAHMMAIDMLNTLRSYLPIYEEDLEHLPPFIRNVQENAGTFVNGWIPKLFEGNFEIPKEA